MRNSSILTTGEAADLCGVSTGTIKKWVDRGVIPGAFTLPGSRDRRIPRASLMDFMQEYGMVPPEETSPARHLLWVGVPHQALGEALIAAGWDIGIAATSFDAGKSFVACRPLLVLVGYDLGCMAATEILMSALRADPPVPVLLHGHHERWTHEFIDNTWTIEDQVAKIDAIMELKADRLDGGRNTGTMSPARLDGHGKSIYREMIPTEL